MLTEAEKVESTRDCLQDHKCDDQSSDSTKSSIWVNSPQNCRKYSNKQI